MDRFSELVDGKRKHQQQWRNEKFVWHIYSLSHSYAHICSFANVSMRCLNINKLACLSNKGLGPLSAYFHVH